MSISKSRRTAKQTHPPLASRALGRPSQGRATAGSICSREWLRWTVGGAAVLLPATACKEAPAAKTPPVPVQVVSATKITAPLAIGANGVVEPLQTVAVQAQVGGTL